MHLSARRAVIIGLLITQICTIGVLALFSSNSGRQAEAEHTAALLDTATAESADRMRSHLAPAEAFVSLTSSVAAADDREIDALVPSFIDALERTPQLAGVFVGTQEGAFSYLSRTDGGYRLKTISVGDDGRRVTLAELNPKGRILRTREDPADTFNPTARPWYTAATATPGVVAWTDPYVFFTAGTLGVTAAKAIPGEGASGGVVGADIELSSLSDFLRTLRVGENGGTVVVDDSGMVIAHPNRDLTQKTTGDGPVPVTIAELDDPSARAAVTAAGITTDSTPLPEGRGPVSRFSTAEDGESQVAFRVVPVGDGAWTVAVFGSEKNFLGDLVQARSRERLLIIATGAVAALLMLFAALPAARRLDDLESAASTDELTGLANRRTILKKSERLTRGPERGAAAILDLDHFKEINDRHGHQVGDEVLRTVSRRIESSLRSDASVGRIGGEEFLILLPDTGPKEAETTCERIRRKICTDPIATSAGDLTVTASIGVAEARGRGSDLIGRADFALRSAKRGGRNRVSSADERASIPV